MRLTLLCASGVAALCASTSVYAQTTGQQPGDETAQATTTTDATVTQPAAAAQNVSSSDIVVTGSRLGGNGYRTPTPVTVATSEQLRSAAPSLTDALRQIPQLASSSSPANLTTSLGGGPSTNSTANLRNLGAQRTLVLLDGRRPPISGGSGTTDMSLFPFPLVKRVDIVTGGASAAYGSDAVTGVVNFVLDTHFKGLYVEGRKGLSSRGDGASYGGEFAAGTSFADDRGRIIVSANVQGQDGVDGNNRSYARRKTNTLANPLFGQPGQPQLILRDNVGLSNATGAGLIITPGVLRDIQFGADGMPLTNRFDHGTNNNGTAQVGGDAFSYVPPLTADYFAASGFAHGEFDVSDDFMVFAEGGYGYTHAKYDNADPFYLAGASLNIRADNAYLPTSIRDQMVQSGINSFLLGKIDTAAGPNRANNESRTLMATAGFKLKMLGDFTLDGYYSHGQSKLHNRGENGQISANMRNAIDAVFDPVTSTITCRSTLTNPANGCVPRNPFGTQPLTDAQRAYMMATSYNRSNTKQDIAALTLRGTLFSLPAGDVAAAVGGEYRRISTVVVNDPISRRLGFALGNFPQSRGSFNVKEVFGEILIPLVKDAPLLHDFSLNGAVRRTDYSTSGPVTTWKVGATDELFDGMRLRATYSQDIRAPNINELFGGVSRTVADIRDAQNGNQSFSNIYLFTGSNSALDPERSRTLTAGFSYQPSWLPGAGLSFDYYKIDIKGAITSVAAQTIADQCAAGNQTLCGQIVRNEAGIITQINALALNIAEAKVAGVDADASYGFDMLGGRATLRTVVTYLDTYRLVTPGSSGLEQAGSGAFPKIRGNVQATYEHGPFNISIQERLVGSVARYLPPTQVDSNRAKATFYTDLTIRYRFEDQTFGQPEMYLTLNNLFDQAPRSSGMNSCALAYCQNFDPALYDRIGLFGTVGFRIRM